MSDSSSVVDGGSGRATMHMENGSHEETLQERFKCRGKELLDPASQGLCPAADFICAKTQVTLLPLLLIRVFIVRYLFVFLLWRIKECRVAPRYTTISLSVNELSAQVWCSSYFHQKLIHDCVYINL